MTKKAFSFHSLLDLETVGKEAVNLCMACECINLSAERADTFLSSPALRARKTKPQSLGLNPEQDQTSGVREPNQGGAGQRGQEGLKVKASHTSTWYRSMLNPITLYFFIFFFYRSV